MKNRKILLFVSLFILLIIFPLILKYLNSKYGNYDYLFVNDHYYIVTGERAEKSDIGEYFFTVKRSKTLSYFRSSENGDSNCLEIGSKIYTLKTASLSKQYDILIAEKDNCYYVARIIQEKQEAIAFNKN